MLTFMGARHQPRQHVMSPVFLTLVVISHMPFTVIPVHTISILF